MCVAWTTTLFFDLRTVCPQLIWHFIEKCFQRPNTTSHMINERERREQPFVIVLLFISVFIVVGCSFLWVVRSFDAWTSEWAVAAKAAKNSFHRIDRPTVVGRCYIVDFICVVRCGVWCNLYQFSVIRLLCYCVLLLLLLVPLGLFSSPWKIISQKGGLLNLIHDTHTRTFLVSVVRVLPGPTAPNWIIY